MKILVTGAAGFLGSRLAGALLAGAPGLPEVSTLVAVDIAAGPHRRSSRRLENRDDHRRPVHEVDCRARCRRGVPPRGGRERSGRGGVRPRHASERRRHARAARGLPSPRETATLRLRELARRLRRRASRHRAGRRRGGAAIVVRLGESDRRAAGARVFEEGIRRRHRLPPALGDRPSRSAQRGRVVVRQRHHSRAACGASTRSARCRSTHASGSPHRSW